VEVHRAQGLEALGKHDQAAEIFMSAIKTLPAGYHRDRGVYLARAAVAHAGSRAPEQAAVVGLQALTVAEDTGSGRIVSELGRLDKALEPWGSACRRSRISAHPSTAPSSTKQERMSEQMATRPYVLLSAATSVDGYLDDTSPERLLLSNAEDFDRVDEVRASCDAILIGATTMRKDNPRLLVNSEERRAKRVAEGKPEYPLKVTVTASGNLDADLKFWHHGGQKLVFTVDSVVDEVSATLGGLADVVSTGAGLDWGLVLDELGRRGVGRLMVEGGGTVHTQLMAANVADEVHLAIAPLLVGQADAPKLLGSADYPGGSTARMRLLEARQVGDVMLLRYAPKERS
jgi:5-amino-6-(5-phosphoribosylamino)uracil reductase